MADDTLTIERVARGRGKTRAKPTPEFIASLETTLRNYYRQQDEQVQQARRVREQVETTPLPQRLRRIEGMEIHDTALNDEIKRIVSSVNSRPPRCRVTPADPQADPDQKNAALRSQWTEQVLYEAGTQSNGQNAYEQNLDACFGDGGAWCKLLYIKDRWETVWNVPDTQDYWLDAATGEEATPNTPADRLKKGKKGIPAGEYLRNRENAKKEAGVPFRLINCDVNTIYPLWRGDDLVAVLEVVERPVIDLLEQYPQLASSKNAESQIYGPGLSVGEAQQYQQTARFLTYTDSTYTVYMVSWQNPGPAGTEVVRTVKHGYGQVPYFFAPGYMMNWWRGRKVGWGIAQDWVGLARDRQFLMNLVVNIAAQAAGTPIQHTRPEGGEPLLGDADQPEGETQLWDLNGLYEAQPGEEFRPITMPGVPDAIKELLALVNDQIKNLQTPRVNAIGTDMSGAGFAYAQIFAEIKVSYDVFVQHLQQMYVEITRFLWKLMRDVVQEKVYVHYTPSSASGRTGSEWLGAGPEDLSDAVGVKWEINSDPPTAEIVRSRYWGERLQQRTANLDLAIEKMGDDPVAIRRGMLIDQLRNEPEYKQLVKEQFLQELGAGDLLKKAAVLAAQSGMIPGMPPEMAQQMMMQHMQGGPGAMQPGQQPGGQVPDMAALAMAQGGAGAAPAQAPYGGAGGVGAVPGGPQVQGPPAAAIQAAMQNLR